MRVTIKIGTVEVTVDRPNFQDYKIGVYQNPAGARGLMITDSIIPVLKEATEKAKELYKFQSDEHPV